MTRPVKDGLGSRTSPRKQLRSVRASAQGKELAAGSLLAGALLADSPGHYPRTPWSAENVPRPLPSSTLSHPGYFLMLCLLLHVIVP